MWGEDVVMSSILNTFSFELPIASFSPIFTFLLESWVIIESPILLSPVNTGIVPTVPFTSAGTKSIIDCNVKFFVCLPVISVPMSKSPASTADATGYE